MRSGAFGSAQKKKWITTEIISFQKGSRLPLQRTAQKRTEKAPDDQKVCIWRDASYTVKGIRPSLFWGGGSHPCLLRENLGFWLPHDMCKHSAILQKGYFNPFMHGLWQHPSGILFPGVFITVWDSFFFLTHIFQGVGDMSARVNIIEAFKW